MAELESMSYPSGSHKTQVSREETGNGSVMQKLESYLKLAQDSTEAVQKMSSSLKFNNGQCEYLAEKLEVVVQRASSFLKTSRRELGGRFSSEKIFKFVATSATQTESFFEAKSFFSSEDGARFTEVFKLLAALAKQIESFSAGCCKDAWIQAAMTLTIVSGYVSSLGFKMELCRLAFCKDSAATGSLTLVQVGDINKAESEIAEMKAEVDIESLVRKLTFELKTLRGDSKDLATYLLQRLLRVIPDSTSEDETFLDRLIYLVKQEEQLGRGASATVHKAKWLGLPVAKKSFVGLDNVEFTKEVDILSRLCHPNITSMFGCTKNEWIKKCSIIMELMDGNLQELMERRCENSNSRTPPFSILEAVNIMLQIGEGVVYLHDQKIVHRDLKSTNILVKTVKTGDIEYVHAKVADFGISKAKDKSTTYSELTANQGTNRWMPPELIQLSTGSEGSFLSKSREEPKHPFKCDTYSFGMVCYEIMTGQEPFADFSSLLEIKTMIMERKRPQLPRECPAKLMDLIKRCWSHEPKERPTFALICQELRYLKYLLVTAKSKRHENVRPDETKILPLGRDKCKTPLPQGYFNVFNPVCNSGSHLPSRRSGGDAGVRFPPATSPNDPRIQSASSTHGDRNVSQEDEDHQNRVDPPPGFSPDDNARPTPMHLGMAITAVQSAVKQFANTLISDMNRHPEGLKHTIRRELHSEVDRANHWKFLVRAFVCKRLFEDFEAENGFFGIQHFAELKMSPFASFADFSKYKNKAATISGLLAKNSRDVSFLGQFCFKKFKSISGDLASDQPWPLYAEDWRIVDQERHPQSEFYQSFLEIAVSVWLLHRLVWSFEQGWRMLGWDTFPQGSKFERTSMKSVVPEGYEENDSTDENMVVGFVVIPGFQVCNSVVTCEVYLRNKNSLNFGRSMEASDERPPEDKRLEKSSSDKIPASYLPGVRYWSLEEMSSDKSPTNLQTSQSTRSSWSREQPLFVAEGSVDFLALLFERSIQE